MKAVAVAIIVYFVVALSGQKTTPYLTLRILDVGQGDAILMRLPDNQDILVDGGPDDRVSQQLGRYMPLGDRTIELLIISHNHADHIGGLKSILEQYEVKQIWISGAIHTTDRYLELLALIKEKQIPTIAVEVGQQHKIGPVELLTLYPPAGLVGQELEDQHDATIVLKVSYQQFCAILTGDINTGEQKHEPQILEFATKLEQSLDCQVLKVTHHGSASGSSLAFLKSVSPKVAVISVGANNRYGHPAPSVLQRLESIGASIYRTDRHGSVTVKTDGLKYWTNSAK